MLTYDRSAQVTGFHIIQEDGNWAEVSYSFTISYQEDGYNKSMRWTLTEEFDNIGDAPHLREWIEVELIIRTDDNGRDRFHVQRIEQ